jgi:Ca-activated chloride channel family protein
LSEVRSSLHALVGEGNRLSIQPGERANRDFVLRLAYGQADHIVHSLTTTPDEEGAEGTFRLTVLPPTTSVPPRPRDLVLLLDRSGSMAGWKMVAARRAAARIVDTLTAGDRFSVLTFDHGVEHPPNLPAGLVTATDRHRYRAVEHLARVDARGGTELLAPLREALSLLTDEGHDRVVVLVTDGQVGNEDQILASTASAMAGIRVHTVGIDQAVNAGFLGRLAAAGGGRSELVESEDRLDEAMERIHRRIGAPAVTGLTITEKGLTLVDGTVAPARLPDLFPGAPLVVTGRYRAEDGASFTVAGHTREGAAWSTTVQGVTADDSSLTAVWARAHLRDLEDRYVTSQGAELEQRITATSLRFGVLCRFTAWLAVDSRVVTEGGKVHRVTQPVETVAGSLMDWPDVEMVRGMTLMAASMPAPAPRLMMREQRPSGGRGKSLSKSGNAAGATQAQQAASPYQAPLPPSAPAGAPRPAPISVPPPGEWHQLVRQAREEAARLRAAQGAPAYERRELLADVGTRLDALVRHLSRTARLAILEQMKKLVAELEADRPLRLAVDEFEALWTRALSVLDEFADEDLNADPAPTERKAFWKKER